VKLLAPSAYTDPAVLPRELARIFGRSWQFAGAASELATPGDFLSAMIAGEPVVLTNDAGRLRALSAVCRHRAGAVAPPPGSEKACGHAKALRCAYHGWAYGLDGRLLAAPEMPGLDLASIRLPEFRAGLFGPFAFASLDPAIAPLSEFFAPIGEDPAVARTEAFRFFKRHDYDLACDWKVYVDNYLEGYHIPVAHPELNRQIDYGAYRVETFRLVSRQHAPVKAADTLYHRDLAEGQAAEARYWWMFPNLMLNLYPDHVQLNAVLPAGPGRCRVRFEWFVPEPRPADWDERFAANFAFSDAVQAEDIALCEAVQRGLGSRTYDNPRICEARENGVAHFHGLWREWMG
jgi:choline monooxygenase